MSLLHLVGWTLNVFFESGSANGSIGLNDHSTCLSFGAIFAMASEDDLVDDLIPGKLKRSPSYNSVYGKKTYGEILRLANQNPTDLIAQKMKKLIEQAKRLSGKSPKRR